MRQTFAALRIDELFLHHNVFFFVCRSINIITIGLARIFSCYTLFNESFSHCVVCRFVLVQMCFPDRGRKVCHVREGWHGYTAGFPQARHFFLPLVLHQRSLQKDRRCWDWSRRVLLMTSQSTPEVETSASMLSTFQAYCRLFQEWAKGSSIVFN